jgi:6,7-dimethyl-8-ribityllumazine synthase
LDEINIIEGELVLQGPVRFGIIASRFNEFIVDHLLSACLDTLQRQGVSTQDITIIKVPGARELPLVAKRMAVSGKFDALIALGAIIRGATAHFDYVATSCSSGLAEIATHHEIPVVFGVLTVDTIEQAIERSGTKAGNKGADAALTAIEMVSLMRKLGS